MKVPEKALKFFFQRRLGSPYHAIEPVTAVTQPFDSPPRSSNVERGAAVIAGAGVIRWRGCQTHGQEKGFS